MALASLPCVALSFGILAGWCWAFPPDVCEMAALPMMLALVIAALSFAAGVILMAGAWRLFRGAGAMLRFS